MPILIDDTTNGVESLFSAIKHYQKSEFGRRKPTISQLIPAIMTIIESNFDIRDRLAGCKNLRIWHEKDIFRNALEEASYQINSMGLAVFHKQIILTEKREDKMKLTDDGMGIQEMFSGGKSKMYPCNGNSCTCSIMSHYMLCRHVIFYRQENTMPIFDISIFPDCYKSKDNNSDSDNEDDENHAERTLSPEIKMVMDDLNKKNKKRFKKIINLEKYQKHAMN